MSSLREFLVPFKMSPYNGKTVVGFFIPSILVEISTPILAIATSFIIHLWKLRFPLTIGTLFPFLSPFYLKVILAGKINIKHVLGIKHEYHVCNLARNMWLVGDDIFYINCHRVTHQCLQKLSDTCLSVQVPLKTILFGKKSLGMRIDITIVMKHVEDYMPMEHVLILVFWVERNARIF